MEDTNKKEKIYTVELSEHEIGIIKAALSYYTTDLDFGFELYNVEDGIKYGYRNLIQKQLGNYDMEPFKIIDKFEQISDVDLFFGPWNDIKRFHAFLEKTYIKSVEMGRKRYWKEKDELILRVANKARWQEKLQKIVKDHLEK